MHRLDDSEVIRDKEHYEEIHEHNIEHGRQRSSSSGYTIDQILREYIIFHRILTEILMKEGAYTTEVGIVLKYALENAMLYSVSLKRSLELIEGLLDSITIQAGEGMIMDFSEVNLVEEITSVHQEASQIYSNGIRV